MTADKARSVAQRNNRLAEIYDAIRAQAELGRFFAIISNQDWIDHGSELNANGYTFRPSTGPDGLCVRVCW